MAGNGARNTQTGVIREPAALRCIPALPESWPAMTPRAAIPVRSSAASSTAGLSGGPFKARLTMALTPSRDASPTVLFLLQARTIRSRGREMIADGAKTVGDDLEAGRPEARLHDDVAHFVGTPVDEEPLPALFDPAARRLLVREVADDHAPARRHELEEPVRQEGALPAGEVVEEA